VTGRSVWVTGHQMMSVDQWLRLALLPDEEMAARAVACGRCGARRNEACLSSTGLPASRPCDVRAAEAAAEAEAAA